MTDTTRPDAAGTEWVLVPKVPTEAMLDAGWIDKEDVSPRDIYGAMLDAAPPAPRLTAERDRLAEAARAYIRAVDRWCALLAEGDTADAAHVACSEADVAIARDRLDAALAQPKPEKEGRS